MRKYIIFALVIILVFLLSGICWAGDKPFGDVNSQQQIIDKLFIGKTLDPIEGIWVKDAGTVITIAKASLANIQKPEYKNIDYIGIYTKGKHAGETCLLLTKTEYSFVFVSKYDYYVSDGTWKLSTPNLLQYDGFFKEDYVRLPQSLIRIYPSP